MERLVDLHAHTDASDGTLAPAALVALAAEEGLAALAITDHDTTAGLHEARIAGEQLGVRIISGIELSASDESGEFHLLGHLFDEYHPALVARLSALRSAREHRASEMVAKLRSLGIALTDADVAAEAGDASMGRPHVARALMRRGLTTSIQDAFDQYLADGRPAAVPKERLSAQEAFMLVHDAGGVVTLAHAVTVPYERREGLIRRLAALGLDGLEVYHSKHEAAEHAELNGLAKELGLVVTGGSDFHGDNKPDVRLGSGRDDNVRVPWNMLESLEARQAWLAGGRKSK